MIPIIWYENNNSGGKCFSVFNTHNVSWTFFYILCDMICKNE